MAMANADNSGTGTSADAVSSNRNANREFIRKELMSFGDQVHSTNPMYLVDKILRERILESVYWKERCFGLTAATLCDRAVELEAIGGVVANLRPCDFLCLQLKLLQINPERDIVTEYLNVSDFKYLQALAALHVRLTWDAVDVYKTLEPLLLDYRKLRSQSNAGYSLTYMDEFVDELLQNQSVCGITLPFLPARETLEELDELEPRVSPLESELNGGPISSGSESD